MALSNDEILDAIANMTVQQAADLVKAMEEKFGVSAAAPVDVSDKLFKFPANISVVIYIYNNSEKIIKCLEHLTKQTFFPSEIILIDDCSTDESCANCTYVAKILAEKGFVISVHKTNKHLGINATRNWSITLAQKKYILFLDCDELLHSESLEYLFRMSEISEADVIYSKSAEDEALKEIKYPIVLSSNIDGRMFDVEKNLSYWSASRKIFKREFLIDNKINFATDRTIDIKNKKVSQEALFVYQCVLLAKNYIVIPTKFYT